MHIKPFHNAITHLLATIALSLTAIATPQAQSGTEQQETLNSLLKQSSMGQSFDYINSWLGQPKKLNDYNNDSLYQVGTCSVEVRFDDNNKSNLIGIKLKEGCWPDFAEYRSAASLPIAPRPLPVNQIPFGLPYYAADCLQSCGNSYDPSVYAIYSEREVRMKLGYPTLYAQWVRNGENNLAENLTDYWKLLLIEKNSEDYVLDNEFNCDDTIDQLSHNILGDVIPDYLWFGTLVIDPPGCF